MPPPVQNRPLRLSPMGELAILADPAGDAFDPHLQSRIWGLARRLRQEPWVEDAVPGVNNLLVRLRQGAPDAEAVLAGLWALQDAEAPSGRTFEFPTRYGGRDGPDLAELAARAGLTVRDAVELHAAGDYGVAAIGAMPGFPYLFGLDPRLAAPRLATPHPLQAGAVIVGGAQAGVMPIDAPSGWRAIGRTGEALFDLAADPPSRLAPGDRVRFVIEAIEA